MLSTAFIFEQNYTFNVLEAISGNFKSINLNNILIFSSFQRCIIKNQPNINDINEINRATNKSNSIDNNNNLIKIVFEKNTYIEDFYTI